MISLRSRWVFIPLTLALVALTLVSLRLSFSPHSTQPPPPDAPPAEVVRKYKPKPPPPPPPLPEYFPLAAAAKSPADLPPVPSWNAPPDPHVPENTRLYIGFTRYWPLLQQVIVGYIAAGWPPSDIYVVENTGTFDANRRGLLTSQNPFYMDYHRLTKIFGVNVITMPSLQTFAQLQNFYLSEAINNNLTHYFWGHMDVVPTTHEDADPYRSLYQTAVDTIRESQAPDFGVDEATGKQKMWAIRFFSYDWFALVNAEAFQKLGGWDSMIGYYGTDCDMHGRIGMNDMITPIADAGKVSDVSRSLDDLEVLFRRVKRGKEGKEGPKEVKEDKKEEAPREKAGRDLEAEVEKMTAASSSDSTSTDANSTASDPTSNEGTNNNPSNFSPHTSLSSTPNQNQKPSSPEILSYLSSTTPATRGDASFTSLLSTLESLAKEKREDPYRNSWQLKQRGGQGEPYYYDADGWEQALQMTIEAGVKINEEKWGHKGCDLIKGGLKQGDQWRVEHDF